jgi:phospholipase C
MLLLVSLLALQASLISGRKINYVICLMMENRAFDHILGLLKNNDSSIEGCLPDMGTMCENPLDPLDPNSQWYPVTDEAVENCTGGPEQAFNATKNEVYGYTGNTNLNPPPMTGFIMQYSQTIHIMDCFPPTKVPALTNLAMDFAVINRYYSSVPGQTVPNRLYLFSATSDGYVNDDDLKVAEGYNLNSIFENIDNSALNQTWSVYFTDEPSAYYLKYPRRHPEKMHLMENFYRDISYGNITNFVFLEPRYNNDGPNRPSQDQEPPHNVGEGDRLIKSVYEAIRASPVWNETLFVLTYDEHGGFFDHVGPPHDSPSPDGIPARDSTPPGFTFNRLCSSTYGSHLALDYSRLKDW